MRPYIVAAFVVAILNASVLAAPASIQFSPSHKGPDACNHDGGKQCTPHPRRVEALSLPSPPGQNSTVSSTTSSSTTSTSTTGTSSAAPVTGLPAKKAGPPAIPVKRRDVAAAASANLSIDVRVSSSTAVTTPNGVEASLTTFTSAAPTGATASLYGDVGIILSEFDFGGSGSSPNLASLTSGVGASPTTPAPAEPTGGLNGGLSGGGSVSVIINSPGATQSSQSAGVVVSIPNPVSLTSGVGASPTTPAPATPPSTSDSSSTAPTEPATPASIGNSNTTSNTRSTTTTTSGDSNTTSDTESTTTTSTSTSDSSSTTPTQSTATTSIGNSSSAASTEPATPANSPSTTASSQSAGVVVSIPNPVSLTSGVGASPTTSAPAEPTGGLNGSINEVGLFGSGSVSVIVNSPGATQSSQSAGVVVPSPNPGPVVSIPNPVSLTSGVGASPTTSVPAEPTGGLNGGLSGGGSVSATINSLGATQSSQSAGVVVSSPNLVSLTSGVVASLTTPAPGTPPNTGDSSSATANEPAATANSPSTAPLSQLASFLNGAVADVVVSLLNPGAVVSSPNPVSLTSGVGASPTTSVPAEPIGGLNGGLSGGGSVSATINSLGATQSSQSAGFPTSIPTSVAVIIADGTTTTTIPV